MTSRLLCYISILARGKLRPLFIAVPQPEPSKSTPLSLILLGKWQWSGRTCIWGGVVGADATAGESRWSLCMMLLRAACPTGEDLGAGGQILVGGNEDGGSAASRGG
jgi:hypothetical protein